MILDKNETTVLWCHGFPLAMRRLIIGLDNYSHSNIDINDGNNIFVGRYFWYF